MAYFNCYGANNVTLEWRLIIMFLTFLLRGIPIIVRLSKLWRKNVDVALLYMIVWKAPPFDDFFFFFWGGTRVRSQSCAEWDPPPPPDSAIIRNILCILQMSKQHYVLYGFIIILLINIAYI